MPKIPDLLGFWLTGAQIGERTNASTTGLLEIGSGTLECDLDRQAELAALAVPVLGRSGSRVGSLRDDTAAEVGAALDVIAVGSHDTASSGRSGGSPAHPHDRSWSTLPVG
jgi:rhamnulokinase